MHLQALPAILTWEARSPELQDLHRRYLELLGVRLGELLARGLGTPAAAAAGAALELAARLDTGTLGETLAAPEVSYRLLWPAHHDAADAVGFVLQALRSADAAARGLPGDGLRWLASGHRCLDRSGRTVHPWGEIEGLPVDAGSPFAALTDVSGERVRSAQPHPLLDRAERERALAGLARAAAGTREAVPEAWRLARDFTKALVLLPDPGAPQQFSSGSSGQFVGRSVLANPHLPKVGEVELAEGLVHEAIHAVLYMDEQHDPWVLDPALYAGPLRVTSPWTGNRLPLRPFLQAAFVWYGLLAFWSRAHGSAAFPEPRVRQRLNEAAAGFLRGPLLDRVAPVLDALAPELRDAIAAMQRQVVAGLGAELAA